MKLLLELWHDSVGDPAVAGWCLALLAWLWCLGNLVCCAACIASF
jgi:hypothetical protein